MKSLKKIIIFFLFIQLHLLINNSISGVHEWKTYTSKKDIRDFFSYNGFLWAASSGGIFSYNLNDSVYTEYTTSEGLRTINITALTIYKNEVIWIGGADGSLHAFHPKNKSWKYINDIVLDTEPNKRINKLITNGDTLYILSDLGLVLLFIPRSEFITTYRRFGLGTTQLQGNVIDMEIYDLNKSL